MQLTFSDLRTVVASMLGSLAVVAHAAAPVHLECQIERTIDKAKGSASPTTGNEHLLISFLQGESISIVRNGRIRYEGRATDAAYAGSAQFNFSGLVMDEVITINRYTGKLEIDLSAKDSGLLHLGVCKQASRKF